MRVEVATPREGVVVLQVKAGAGLMSVVQATAEMGGAWRVRALLAGHEELAESAAAAATIALEDVHEAFPGRLLELAPLCESCERRPGDLSLTYPDTTFLVCAGCAAVTAEAVA